MVDEKGPARPQQVTFAGVAVIGGSLVLLLAAFDQISTLHSLDTRTAVERLIGDQPDGLGITVTGWLHILKIVAMVTGACAAAAVILGWQTLQRSRTARVVLSVVAVPMVLAGLALEPLFSILVAVAVIVLWLPTASAWFDGREPSQERAESQPPPPSAPAASLPEPPPYVPPAGLPSPYASPAPYTSAPPPQQPSPYPSHDAPVAAAPSVADRRPSTVTTAAVITFVLAGITALLGVLLAVVGGTMTEELLDELHARGYDTSAFTADEIGPGFAILGVLVAVASLVAVVAAYFVLRRAAAARAVLTVMAGLCAALSLIGVASGGSLITLVGATVVLVLLHRRASNAWFKGR